jgi:predicted CXXCH cytochrome family protein
MDALLRELQPSADGIAEYRDVEASGDTLTLGSAPDRAIQLLGDRIAPEHAELTLAKRGVQVTCRRGFTVRVNGKDVASATLAPGDSFEIGGNTLTLLDPPAGFDIGVQIELDPDVDASVFEQAFRTDLNQGWFSTRPMAWILSAAVLLLAFLVPVVMTSTTGSDSALRSILPGDALWTSGPLHPAHALATGDDCRACHVEFFERVPDSACQNCHAAINDHVHAEVVDTISSLDPAPRCATCHREHNEPIPHLVITADALCTDCHADPGDLLSSMGTAPVTGFSDTEHPAFKASLLKPLGRRAGTGLTFDWETSVEPVSFATEVSNLKFPHDTHLDPGLVTDLQSGDGLGCSNCHELSLDREHFIPVTMESVCVECHELTFDPQMPDRQLPHGQPLEVMLALEGQYLRKFSDPNVPQEAVVRRRIPDRDNSTRECVDTAFNCAAEAAASDISEQFTVRGCISCHVVEEHENSEIYARYQVHPVRLAQDFFPAGRFDHFSHQVMKEDTGDTACLQCHAANESSESADLLIPDIDNCLGCHSDTPKAGRVTVGCVACHSYHPYASGYTGTIETEQL